MRSILLILPLLAAGCASSEAPEPLAQGRHADRIAAARPVGTPTNCVPITSIRQSRVLSDQVIDFELIDGTTMRSVLPYRCSGLGFEESFTYSTSLSQLCSTDIITVLRQGGGTTRGASCGLGQFQQVEFPARS